MKLVFCFFPQSFTRMNIKSFNAVSGQRKLSRDQMKAVSAGRPLPEYDCSVCICNSGASYYNSGSCVCDSGYALPCSIGTGNQ